MNINSHDTIQQQEQKDKQLQQPKTIPENDANTYHQQSKPYQNKHN